MQKMEAHPKNLFLIDGVGALLSAFLLGIVLVHFESIFGIPASALYILAAAPVLFVLYDFYAYRKAHHAAGPWLIGIAIMNLAYCFLSAGLVLHHREAVKFWGWYYIISEIMILLALVYIEFTIGKKLIQQHASIKKSI